jgi:methionyl-tRNA formyltransferase
VNLALFFDHAVGNSLLRKFLDTKQVDLFQCITTESNFILNPWIKRLCEDRGVPFLIFEKLHGTDLFIKADTALLASWKYIMTEEIIEFYEKNLFNLHYSLLPKFAGSYPVNQFILSGERTSGFTIHRVTKEVDRGPIVFQKEIPIQTWENTEDYMTRVDNAVVSCFDEIVRGMSVKNSGNSEISSEYPLVTKSEIKGLREISGDTVMSLSDFLRLIRAMTFPSKEVYPYFFDPITGEKIEIQMKLIRKDHQE